MILRKESERIKFSLRISIKGLRKIGVLPRQARESSGITQEQVAKKLRTNRSAISRMENHAEDIRLSTLRKYAEALGKEIRLEIA